jgi:hypothetical protein
MRAKSRVKPTPSEVWKEKVIKRRESKLHSNKACEVVSD